MGGNYLLILSLQHFSLALFYDKKGGLKRRLQGMNLLIRGYAGAGRPHPCKRLSLFVVLLFQRGVEQGLDFAR